MINLINLYPQYHWDDKITDIVGYEVFVTPPKIQLCNKIQIKMSLPYSEINFQKNEGIMALKCLSIKLNPGLYKYDCDVYLNNKIFTEDYDDIFEKLDENEYIIKYENYLKKLKNNNKFTIFFKTVENFAYTNHILLYPVKFEDDETYLDIELERWKLLSKQI